MKLRANPYFSSRLFTASLVITLGQSAMATDYTWTQSTIGTHDWTVGTNWGVNGQFVSGSTNGLVFFANTTTNLPEGAMSITANVPTALTLNSLTLNGRGPGTGALSALTVAVGTSASTWTFDGATPKINLNGVSATKNIQYTVAANLAFNQNTEFTGNGTGNFTFSGGFSGGSSVLLTKSGTSTLSLTGTNSGYSGNWLISGGVLQLTSGGAVLNGSNIIKIDSGGTLRVNNSNTIAGLNDNSGSGGSVTNSSGSGRTLTIGGTGVYSFAGNFDSTAASRIGLVLSGTGTQTLSGNNAINTNTGYQTVTGGGTLVFAKQNSIFQGLATGAVVNTNTVGNAGIAVFSGTVALGVGDSLSGYFDSAAIGTFLNGSHMGASTSTTGFQNNSILGFDTTNATSSTFTYSTALANIGSSTGIGFAKLGAGTLILDAANTYTGVTQVRAGTLQIGAGSTTGALASTADITVSSGATLAFNRTDTALSQSNKITGAGSVSQNGTGTTTLTASTSDYSGGTSISAGRLIASSIGSGAVNLSGTATQLTLGRSSTYSNAITISSALGRTNEGLIDTAGGINATLSGPITINATPTNGGHFGSSSSGSLTITGAIASSVPVFFQRGNITLSGPNTYTGTSTIRAGTVVVGVSDVAATSGAFGNASSNILLTDATSGASDNVSLLISGAFTLNRNITVQNNAASGTTSIGSNSSSTSIFGGNITLNKGVTLVSNVTAGQANFTGAIGGTGDIRVTGTGSGQVRFSGAGANTYNGTVFVDSGELRLAGSGSVAAITGNLTIASGATLTSSVGNKIADAATINNSGNFTFISGTNETIGVLAMSGSAATTSTSSTSIFTLGSASVGTDVLTMTGGTINIGASAGNTGFLRLNGNVSVASSANVASISSISTAASTLNLSNLGAATRTFNVATGTGAALGNELTISASIVDGSGGAGGILKSGTGTMTLSGTSNTYTGLTNVTTGALSISSSGSLASGNALTIGASGTADFANASQNLGAVSNSNTATSALNFSNASGTVVLASLTGSGNTRFGSTGTVTGGISSGTVTSVGALNANISGGTITAGGLLTGTVSSGTVGAGSLSSTSVTGGTNTITGAAGITSLNGGSTTVGGVATIGTLTSGTASLNGSTSSITTLNGGTVNLGSTTLTVGSGTTSGAITGASGALTVTGALALNGTNSYGGITSVSTGGDLRVNGTNSGGGAVNVAAGANLGGSGSVIGGINVSGVLAPGNSIESLGSGSLNFLTGSTYSYELQTNLFAGTPNVAGDLAYSSSTLSIASGTILTLTDLGGSTALANGSKLTLISSVGAWNLGLFSYDAGAGPATLADDSNITLGLNTWTFNYNDTIAGSNFTGDTTGATNFVTLTVIPEPSPAVLVGGLGVLALLRRRRR